MDPATPLQPYVPAAPAANPIPAAPMPAYPGAPMPQMPVMNSNPVPPNPYQPMAPPMPYAPLASNPMGAMPQPEQPSDPRLELIEKLRSSNNILITVNSNPTVDQLSAAIGLTLVLNKLDKHATAVFSGATPSTIEFLQPEKTIEKNTDSLRDFIIALDKAKADKLRYKVEDTFVKIFITPYHTSLSEKDLEFSQGDFNVDVVVALGVHQMEELDQAITAHGRILHDAVTVSVNNKQTAELGAVNWFQSDASSLCEMVVGLIEPLQGDKVLLDTQIATAFLTGIVAETERFSNTKTTPHTMNTSAILMKAGANQQLVASKLEEPKPIKHDDPEDAKKLDEIAHEGIVPSATKDGSLEVSHKKADVPTVKAKTMQEIEKENRASDSSNSEGDSDLAKIHIDDDGKFVSYEDMAAAKAAAPAAPPAQPSNMILTPPTIGGDMSATMRADDALEPPKESHDQPTTSEHHKTINPLSADEKEQTLEQIEKAVDSKHLQETVSAEDTARAAVESVTNTMPGKLEPTAALNAQPVDLQKEADPNETISENVFPPQLIGPDTGPGPDPTAGASDPTAPPLVPPPLMPPSA